VLTGAFIGVPALMITAGMFHPDSQVKEAGLLSGEAMIDGLVVQQGMKLVFRRERPSVDQYKGKFFTTSATADSGFPSSHSVVAWSSAAVLADEYNSRLSQLTIYTLATGVSLTRVLGQQHFPSDVLIGSAAGWLIGHYVYRHHRKDRLNY
jgi:membrane-associated phospholipid phosphatase